MPFKTLDDIVDPAHYQKNLLAGLKASQSKVAKLHFFEDFPFKGQTATMVLVGPVEKKLIEQITATGARLKVKGSVIERDEEIHYKAGSLKADVLNKALRLGKIHKSAVAKDDLADAADDDGEETSGGASGSSSASAASSDALLLAKAKESLPALEKRATTLLDVAQDDHKARINANLADCKRLVEAAAGKDALKAVAVLDQLLDDLERVYEQLKAQTIKRVTQLTSRLTGYKPPVHEKLAGAFKDSARSIVKAIGEPKIDWKAQQKACADLEAQLDGFDTLAEEFATQQAELQALKARIKPLRDYASSKAKTMPAPKKLEFAEQLKQAEKPKLPTVLYAKAPFTEALAAQGRLLAWLETNAKPSAEETETDPVLKRMKKFVRDNPNTWELNPVAYRNGTSAGDVGNKLTDLTNAALASNTTAHGSVLKVNYEGHAHLDGGSGGVAFVYKLEDDYTVTPIVVDISGKRGGKNGNQYEWNTGGGWAYFPPNASY